MKKWPVSRAKRTSSGVFFTNRLEQQYNRTAQEVASVSLTLQSIAVFYVSPLFLYCNIPYLYFGMPCLMTFFVASSAFIYTVFQSLILFLLHYLLEVSDGFSYTCNPPQSERWAIYEVNDFQNKLQQYITTTLE